MSLRAGFIDPPEARDPKRTSGYSFYRSPGHHVDGGSLALILATRSATNSLFLRTRPQQWRSLILLT